MSSSSNCDARTAARNNRLQKNIESMIARGRRNSAAALARLRSGSLPSWAGGPPTFPNTPTIDEENEFGFPTEDGMNMDDVDGAEDDSGDKDGIPVKEVQVEEITLDNQSGKIIDKNDGNVDLGLVLSALYCKLLVVMGIAFPLAEVISSYIPPRFYDGFYLYLYSVSILFMVCILGNVVKQKMKRSAWDLIQRVAPDVISNGKNGDSDESDVEAKLNSPKTRKRGNKKALEKMDSGNSLGRPNAINKHHFGSFYLRMGAVSFGIGSMIYSGLEFGQYFEMDKTIDCHSLYMAATPAIRMIFTFMQMYFIFFNSKMAIGKTSLVVQFGLMHMIGTNLSVWLNVLVEETRHEILHFYDPENQTIILHHFHGGDDPQAHHGHSPTTDTNHQSNDYPSSYNGTFPDAIPRELHRMKRGLKAMHKCGRSNLMGNLVDNASPFLFPCTIEYSLICAAICYVMWKSTAKRRVAKRIKKEHGAEGTGISRSHHHYTVDCSRANKGLFLGIFVLVLTIMSLILNFVMVSKPGYKEMAMVQVNITEVVVYSISTLAVLLGMCQVRELRYDRGKNLELDNILLIVAQTGSFIYNVFTIISGQFSAIIYEHTTYVLVSALTSLIQLLLQTLFIIDASKRTPATVEQSIRKPGREVVTFLLITNLAMWLIHTLENSRGDSHPVQLHFYGVWAWTIITDISMPLAIFYRFHSTVCLCEIWKKAYKVKGSQ